MRQLLRATASIAVGVAVLGSAGACASQTSERPLDRQNTAVAPVALEGDAAEAPARGISVGREDAPVVVFEFADFQCPACARFAEIGTPMIKDRHVETGTVRYVHYDLPLVSIHPEAFLAARAGRCADDQGRFWAYHDELYAQQQNWSRQGDVAPLFVQYAGDVGLDTGAFEACLRSDRHAEEITRNMRLAESLDVRGTPTLFVNGQRAEIRTLEDLDRMIQEAAGSAAR